MRLLCLTHVAFEGPARVADWASRRGHDLGIVRADLIRDLPPTEELTGLVIMGGPMSANDSFSWLRREIDFIEDVLKRGLPVLGVCLGAQLLANIFGSRIYRAAHGEIGWWPIKCLPHASARTLRLPESFVPLHWHGETFELPSGAVRLAESEAVANQAFLLDSHVLGLQFHIEATPESVGTLVREAASAIEGGPYEQSARSMLEESEARCAALERPAYSLLDGFFGAPTAAIDLAD